jgi:hypothetical protein
MEKLYGDFTGDGALHWSRGFSNYSGKEGVVLEIRAGGQNVKRREALRGLAEKLAQAKVHWLRPIGHPNGKWIIDFDRMATEFPFLGPISWLSGRVAIDLDYEVTERQLFGQPHFEGKVEVVLDPEELEMSPMVLPPRELEPFLELLRLEHPDPMSCGFVMMKFDQSRLHAEIVSSIRDCLSARGLKALRADDRSYSDDLLPNIRTYMHGCAFGIAVFERLTADEFNPNVSLEVGYMMALGKPVLLLKDSTLRTLHADLVGRLYSTFDPQNPSATIPPILSRWLSEKNLG